MLQNQGYIFLYKKRKSPGNACKSKCNYWKLVIALHEVLFDPDSGWFALNLQNEHNEHTFVHSINWTSSLYKAVVQPNWDEQVGSYWEKKKKTSFRTNSGFKIAPFETVYKDVNSGDDSDTLILLLRLNKKSLALCNKINI